MRVTSSMYYKSLYGSNNSQLQTKLFDVNKQIASGIKIQYANEDVTAFTETMRLDNEITTLQQIKKSTESGYKVSNQTDVVLNEFEDTMNRMRTLLLNAANGTHSDTSLDAIADELRVMEDHFKNLSNTSINGQYLFSGSAVDIKPISDDGTYNGNDISMNSFLGSRSQQQYNLSGADLFLGEEILVRREVTTNVVQNHNAPSVSSTSNIISTDSTISEFMGDINAPNNHYFYVRGVKSDGLAINKQITMSDTETVDDLLTKIGNAYGNNGKVDLVNVSLNENGQIVIEDKIKGSSKLDFHIVGATDFSGGGAANVTDIDDLDIGSTTDYSVMSTTPGLYVKEFVKSSYTEANGAASNIDGILYDKTQFSISGNSLSSNVPQIDKNTNAFATPSTKISEVADTSKGTIDTSDDTLAGTQFILSGSDVNGNAYDVTIDLDKSVVNGGAGSTFTIGGNTYDIFDLETPRAAVDADNMTYQQLMDVMNMITTGAFPDVAYGDTATEYDAKIYSSNFTGTTFLTHDGKINFNDFNANNTNATIALYDANSGNFTLDVDSNGDGTNDKASSSVMSFNTNNSLTIRDPKTDFFKTIDEMITAVENHKLYPDHKMGDNRNVGIENAISMMDDIQDHVFRSHSQVGANSNALTASLERTEILEISTQTLRSSVIDTDLAEASLELTQLTLNYEAMLSTVGKVSKLSLVNYL